MQGFAISPHLQEIMAYVGQLETYAKGVEVIDKLVGIKISVSQLYRVANRYGMLVEEQLKEECLSKAPVEVAQVNETEVVYAEMDGGMVLTDDGWLEAKVGRVFRESDCKLSTSENRNGSILQSQYSAYIGHYHDFTQRLNLSLSAYSQLGERLIFITDGALWIKNWMSDHYPNATQILDFFHVKEHLADFAKLAKPGLGVHEKWLDEQSLLLKQGKSGKIISNVRSCTMSSPTAKKEQQKLLNYLSDNEYRMRYNEYLEAGLFIGSGAIEAAHRTVVQCRMKRSGQRWSPKGAQHMLNLRVTYMSNQWQKIINLIQSATDQAA